MAENSTPKKTTFDEAFLLSPPPDGKKPRRSFSTNFKLKVIAAAETSSNREQARVHNVNECIIRRWRKDDKPAKILELFFGRYCQKRPIITTRLVVRYLLVSLSFFFKRVSFSKEFLFQKGVS